MARTVAGPASEERRQQIVEAALRVFARKGFTEATNRDIAQEAGVTPGLIYHYFTDKRAVLDVIFTEHSPLGENGVLAVIAGMYETDPRTLLTLLATNVLARLEGSDGAPAFRLLMGE